MEERKDARKDGGEIEKIERNKRRRGKRCVAREEKRKRRDEREINGQVNKEWKKERKKRKSKKEKGCNAGERKRKVCERMAEGEWLSKGGERGRWMIGYPSHPGRTVLISG